MPWFRTSDRKSSSFSNFSDDFYLDDHGILQLKDIPKDDQAVIDSYFGSRLEAILDQYSDVIAGMNGYNLVFDDKIVEINNQKRDLERCLEVDQLLDDYRSSDPSLAKLSHQQLIKSLQEKYNASVEAYKAKFNNDKGESKDETEKKDVTEGE